MMKKLLLPIIIIGASGIGAVCGYFLKLKGAEAALENSAEARTVVDEGAPRKASPGGKKGEDPHGAGGSAAPTYMKFSRQFVAPVMRNGVPAAMMILDVNVEMDPALSESAYAKEPRLRDAVLRVLLRLSSDGSLGDLFSDPDVLEEARSQILNEVRGVIGDGAQAILIMDVGYQTY